MRPVDAVVVGAGPNGLAAAITIARTGRTVVVYEAADVPGGGTRSEALTLDGFVHDVCSAVHPLAAVSPFFAETDLARHGLELLHPDIPLAHPLDGGRAAVLHRSLDDTADELGADGRSWRRTFAPLVRRWDDVAGHLLGPLVRVPRHPVPLARFGLTAVQPTTWAVRRFDTPEAKALFAGNAAHSFAPLTHPFTSAFGLMLGAAGHVAGWPVAKGGSQAIADAMVAELASLGGEVRTSSPVRRLDDLPPSQVVLFDTGPRAMAQLADDRLPARQRRRYRSYRYGTAAFKVDYALSEPVPWTNPACRRAGTVHVGGTVEEIAAAEAQTWQGRMPDRPFLLVCQPTVADPTRAPEGRHVLWVYAHVPAGYDGDAVPAIEAQIERFAPGFADVVLARNVLAPAQLEARNPNLVGGDVVGGANTGLGALFRPTLSLRPYRTRDPRLFLCSASTPPGAGVHGMCGVHAARAALHQLGTDPS